MNLCIDLEATCWREEQKDCMMQIMETIEIGAVIVDNKMDVVSEFNMFIQPVLNPTLSKYCKDLTHIKQSDVNEAHIFPFVWDKFNNWIGEYNPKKFVSWGDYDNKQLRKDCLLHRVEMFNIPHTNIKQVVLDKYGITSKRKGMDHIMKKVGMEFVGTRHRAIDDVKNMIILLKKVAVVI